MLAGARENALTARQRPSACMAQQIGGFTPIVAVSRASVSAMPPHPVAVALQEAICAVAGLPLLLPGTDRRRQIAERHSRHIPSGGTCHDAYGAQWQHMARMMEIDGITTCPPQKKARGLAKPLTQ